MDAPKTKINSGTMRLGPGEPAARAWNVVPVHAVTDVLLGRGDRPRNRPRVIAVDGRSGSGKTTVAERLAAAMPGAVVVHTDDVAWHHSFFDWDDLLVDNVLRPLHQGHAIAYRPAAWVQRKRKGSIVVPGGCPVVVLEGVGAARRELLPWVDAIAWVQADVQQAWSRGVARDGGDAAAAHFWREWGAQEEPFLTRQRPWDHADIFVAGTNLLTHDPETEMVVASRAVGQQHAPRAPLLGPTATAAPTGRHERLIAAKMGRAEPQTDGAPGSHPRPDLARSDALTTSPHDMT